MKDLGSILVEHIILYYQPATTSSLMSTLLQTRTPPFHVNTPFHVNIPFHVNTAVNYQYNFTSFMNTRRKQINKMREWHTTYPKQLPQHLTNDFLSNSMQHMSNFHHCMETLLLKSSNCNYDSDDRLECYFHLYTTLKKALEIHAGRNS